ncbi:pleckstrin homology domain-containing family B member 2 isoform X2 [Mobula birostris]|uniref:pleckstrin homology domain-containing family B member 2 isoform X2 n=1 Tax=Mobula birostris TaxID=1983395 RepID=UPI003B283A8A
MAYIKSGWLHRQSTILKRWKNNWFDLWSSGHLFYYDDQLRVDMEDKIHMKVDCVNIRSGYECRDFQPPEGKSKDCLLQIVCRDGRTINLCAESPDDSLAWKIALQDARTNSNIAVGPEVLGDNAAFDSAPPPYTAYPTAPAQVLTPRQPITLSFKTGDVMMETWHWVWWQELPLVWHWDHCSGHSKALNG